MLKRLIIITLGILLILFSLFSPMALADNNTEPFNQTQANDTIDEWKNRIQGIDWQRYAKGTIGFVFIVTNLAYQGFTTLALEMGAPQEYASTIGLGAGVILFIAIMFSLASGIAKIVKVGMKYGIIISAVVVVLSLIFGFLL